MCNYVRHVPIYDTPVPPESLHALHGCVLHAVELLLPAVVVDLGLDQRVGVGHGAGAWDWSGEMLHWTWSPVTT